MSQERETTLVEHLGDLRKVIIRSLIVLFLTRLGIVTPAKLRKARKVAYLILVAIAVLITPPDFISDILVAIPLALLYELSILLSVRSYRQQQDRQVAITGKKVTTGVQS